MLNNNINNFPVAFSFDDILIEPKYSEIKRGEANIVPKAFKNIAPRIPIISSPMSTVTEYDMIVEMLVLDGLAIRHRYCDINKLLSISQDRFANSIENDVTFGEQLPIAVGSIPSHKDAIDKLIQISHKFFCVDVANGTHINALNTYKYIREQVPSADIMSGSIATPDQANLCIQYGCNVLRIGVGSGSACITRVVTGIGVPLAYSIYEISNYLKNTSDIVLVADGGIRNSGDLVKALALGADYAIIGKLFAGTDESPGEIMPNFPMFSNETQTLDEVINNARNNMLKSKNKYDMGKWYKFYRGMASKTALVEENGKDPNHLHVEGEEFSVPYIGPVKNVVGQLVNGLKQAMFYTGSHSLYELKQTNKVLITQSGNIEGAAHGKN